MLRAIRRMAPRSGWNRALLLLIAALGFFLIVADKPWDEKLRKRVEDREAEGRTWKIDDYATVYLWYAALANLALAGGLLATSRWWAKPIDGRPSKPTAKLTRWFWIGAGAAVVVGGISRAPRLGHSFWNDEEYAFRTYVWGEASENENGELNFRPVPWKEAFFRNKSNNHITCTVAARWSHSVWKAFSGENATFSEAAVRVVPFVVSLASLLLIAVLLARIGSPIAGIAAAIFLALDPWHIRYSVEMRGYTYVLLFMVLGFLQLFHALRTGRWRNWLVYGLCQVLILLSFPAAVYEVAAQNGIALVILLIRRPIEWRSLGRLIVANVLGGMLFLQIFAPSIPQMMHWLANNEERANIGWGWVRDWWSHAVEGIPWSAADPALSEGTSALRQAIEHPGAWWEIIIIVPTLALLGLLMVLFKRRAAIPATLAPLLGAAAAYLVAAQTQSLFHSWYLIYSVAALAVLVACGVEFLAWLLSPGGLSRWRMHVHIGMQAIFLLTYSLFTSDPRHRIVNYDRQPLRQAVAEVRGESPAHGSQGGEILSGSFGTSRGMFTSYDPRNRILKKPDDLEKLVSLARSANQPLYVYHFGRLVAMNHPVDSIMLQRVEESGEFEEIAYLKGLEEMFSCHIYRLKSPTASDARAVPPNRGSAGTTSLASSPPLLPEAGRTDAD